MPKDAKRKPAHLDQLVKQRQKAALLMMDQAEISIADVTQKTGVHQAAVYRALKGVGGAEVIEFLETRLGSPFRNLWRNYGRSAAGAVGAVDVTSRSA